MAVSHVLDAASGAGGESAVGLAGARRLVQMLSQVPDPRKPRGVRHQVGAVLAMMVFAVLSGARTFREIADRAADLPQELLALGGCRQHPATGGYVPPSEPTIRGITHGIDAAAADDQVYRWLREQAQTVALTAEGTGAEAAGGLVGVAMDGKLVRNTVAPGSPEGHEVKLFAAMLHRQAVVIAQVRVPDDTTETTQVAALLAEVDLSEAVVTGDAAHAQHTTAAYLNTDKGGHYVLTVKANQPRLLSQITAALPPAVPGSHHHLEQDHSKGRIVHRAIWTAPADGVAFPGATQVFRLRRDTFDHHGNRLSKEVVHGLTSLDAGQATAEVLAGLIRDHWGIENKIHWVRDAVWREDHQHAYAGSGVQVMATLRNLALGLLHLAGISQIKRTLERLAADRTRILPILATAISP